MSKPQIFEAKHLHQETCQLPEHWQRKMASGESERETERETERE